MSNWAICENEPKTNPNFETTKNNANLFTAKDYEKNRVLGPGKTNPIRTQNKAKQSQKHLFLWLLFGVRFVKSGQYGIYVVNP